MQLKIDDIKERKAEQRRAQKRDATGSLVLIYLEGRVILLIKRSMVLSRAFLLLLPVSLQGNSKKTTKHKQTNAPLFVALLHALLPSNPKAHDPASLAAFATRQ